MKDHLDIMRMVKRKRLSEDRLRKLNMYEIAEEIHGLEDSNKAMLKALETIDAMPLYTAPIQENYISGLLVRYHKALDLAAVAIKAAK